MSLQWRHNERDGGSNHRRLYCLLILLFSSASLACVRVIQRWLVNSPHKGPVTRKKFPLNDVIRLTTEHPRNYVLGVCTLLWFGSGGFYHRIGKAIRVTSLVTGDVEAWGESLIAFNWTFMKFADDIPIVEENKHSYLTTLAEFQPPWWQIIGRHWWLSTIIWNIDNAIYVILGVDTSWVSCLKWFDFWPLWSNFNLVVAEKWRLKLVVHDISTGFPCMLLAFGG